jgi:hypothetical protein
MRKGIFERREIHRSNGYKDRERKKGKVRNRKKPTHFTTKGIKLLY